MLKTEIQGGKFCHPYNDPDCLFQIIGVAKTEDVNSYDKYNKKAHFFARGADKEDYLGFIFPKEEIIISWNRRERVVGDDYVLFRPLIKRTIWAMKLQQFMEQEVQMDFDDENIEPFKTSHFVLL